ncbi:MAG: hypothetical protein AB7T49_06135 [Oligoflexales bacterium]
MKALVTTAILVMVTACNHKSPSDFTSVEQIADEPEVTLDHARDVALSIESELAKTEGFRGIGVGMCDSDTGEMILGQQSESSVYCAIVYATPEKKASLEKAYPIGTVVQGVFVRVAAIQFVPG